jgi:hypothetical protein
MNKQEQKQLIIDIMNEDAKDGLYKKQTAVEWLAEQIEQYILTYSNLPQNVLSKFKKQAKEMEEQQRIDAIKNELKLIGNYFDVGKLDQREQGHHIRFTSILKDRFDFYNETNGGNK